jgi:hypothetical protein
MRPSPVHLNFFALALACVSFQPGTARAAAATDSVPSLDHVVVLVMENKTYDQARVEAFTASLISQSSSFSHSYALTHPSQPNYLGLWSGSAQGVTNDDCPPAGSPYAANNLGKACEAAGITWRAYCENLPAIGSSVCSDLPELYVRRHCPWTNFSNLSHSKEVPFTQLAVDESLGTLPRLAFVIPNDCDNTHDCDAATGDAWMANQVPSILAAIGTNGVLITTWDEDDGSGNNQILTIFTGHRVKLGYVSSASITHYTVLRTICAVLGLQPFGSATAESPISNIWTAPADHAGPGAGRELSLSAPVPNPSGGGVQAVLQVSRPEWIDAAIYDLGGRRIRGIFRGSISGQVHLAWDGHDSRGRPSPAGVYVLCARMNSTTLERRFVRLR